MKHPFVLVSDCDTYSLAQQAESHLVPPSLPFDTLDSVQEEGISWQTSYSIVIKW